MCVCIQLKNMCTCAEMHVLRVHVRDCAYVSALSRHVRKFRRAQVDT